VKNTFVDDWEEEDQFDEFPTVPLHKASTDQNNDYRLGILGTRNQVDTILYKGINPTNANSVSQHVEIDEDGTDRHFAPESYEEGDSDTVSTTPSIGPSVSLTTLEATEGTEDVDEQDESVSKDTADTLDKDEAEPDNYLSKGGRMLGVASTLEAVVKSTVDGDEAAPRAQPTEDQDASQIIAMLADGSELPRSVSGARGSSSGVLSPNSFDDANEQVKKRWQCIQTIMVGEKYQHRLKSGQEIPPPPNPAGQYSKRKWELAMAEWRNSLT